MLHNLFRSPGSRKTTILFAVLGLLALLYAGRQTRLALSQAARYTNNPDYDAEERIHFWLASAACTQQKHVLLALCDAQGKLYPIEDGSLADDRGHALLLDLWAWGRTTSLDSHHLTELNIGINAVGVLVLSLAFLLSRMPVTSLLCLVEGTQYAIPGPIPGPDAPAAFIGILCLALVPVVCLSGIFSGRSGLLRKSIGVLMGLAALSAACLLREPIGLVGIAGSLVFLGLQLRRPTSTARPWLHLGCGSVLLLLPLGASPIVLALRNLFFHLPSAQHIAMHGISQTLFHGLGTEPNPWGIQWSDAYGIQRVHQIDPHIGYLTPAYSRVMRRLYWQLVWHQPFAVLRVYALKCKRVVSLPFRVGGLNLFLAAGLIGATTLSTLCIVPENRRLPLRTALGLAITGFFFLLQGVLGVPWGNYLYPMKFLVVLMLCCFADLGWRYGTGEKE